MRYRVHHETRYTYEEPVSQCFNEFHLTPRDTPGQKVLETAVRVTPWPSIFQHRSDYFGNNATAVEILERHKYFEAVADSLIDVEPASLSNTISCPWEHVRELLHAQESEETLEASEFTCESHFVPSIRELEAYAKPTFIANRPIVEAVAELSHRIYTEFRYMPQSTSIEMPLGTILRNRRGVCQDYAHIMIGALRSHRLAARYVSGYLRSNPGFHGAEASHAWVAVWIPGYGWMAVDPTNDVVPSDAHVTLAWGRDYADVAPIRGLTLGGGAHKVEVAVRVEPIAPAAK